MVILLENWKTFREYLEKWPLAELIYNVEVGKERARVRIVAGRYGVDLTFQGDDPSFREILEFLRRKSAKRTVQVIQDAETFFSR